VYLCKDVYIPPYGPVRCPIRTGGRDNPVEGEGYGPVHDDDDDDVDRNRLQINPYICIHVYIY
jgi:hypothetical protein